MSKIDHSQTTYRSALYRTHETNGANFVALGEGSIVNDYGNPKQELETRKKLALIDLTSVSRIGFKGSDTPTWLEKQKIDLPLEPNKAVRLSDGSLVTRLSSNEFFILGDLAHKATTCSQLAQNWEFTEDNLCYLLHRNHSHAHFILVGEHAEEVMPKICGVNLRESDFAYLDVAQTSLARVSSIIIRDKLSDGTLVFHLLFDSSMAEYMWMCLLDAGQEFSGKPVGLQALL